eukprot:TRINITY_DN7504_c0_g1_i1.p1 TRINITY_DN7504_c0_g1~~TRINITY_DN7504_c0_g1_i1.p1  ORF type:complete len:859 (+),score=192.29 TRINITY_DN7504_c0_g1_i1:51-2579(+)
MDPPVERRVWTRDERRRVREKHRAGESLTTEELEVYRRDKDRRRVKHQEKVARQSAAQSQTGTPRGADGTDSSRSVISESQAAPPAIVIATTTGSGRPSSVPKIDLSPVISPARAPAELPTELPTFMVTDATPAEPIVVPASTLAAPQRPATRPVSVAFRDAPTEFDNIEGDSDGELSERSHVSQRSREPAVTVNPLEQAFPARKYHAAAHQSSGAGAAADDLDDSLAGDVTHTFRSANVDDESTADAKRRADMNCFQRCFHDTRKKIELHAARRRDTIPLWRDSIKTIDGRYGSSVVSFFIYMRWLFLLNFVLMLVWFSLVCVPFIVSYGWGPITLSQLTWQSMQGVGFNTTFFYYGGYPQSIGTRWWFDIDYVIVLLATFALSMLAILIHIRGVVSRGGEGISLVRKDHKLPFSTLLFNSWDFTLTDKDAAITLQHGVTQLLREQLMEESLKRKDLRRRTTKEVVCKVLLRILGALLTLVFLAGTLAVITVLVAYKTQIESLTSLGPLLTTVIVAVVNAGVPMCIRIISAIESWDSDRTRLFLLVGRIYVIKILNVVYLMFQLYTQATANAADTCPESVVGETFWRLLVTDLGVGIVTNSLPNLMIFLINKHFRKLPEPRLQFDLAGPIIDIIYRQILVWIGMIWVPILPFFACVTNFILFYITKWVLLLTCRAPERPWDASKISTFFFGTLTFTLLICIAPLSYFFARSHKITDCGPHARYPDGAYTVFSTYVQLAPTWVQTIVFWLFNPIVLILIVFLLIVVIYFMNAKLNQFGGRLEDTNKELMYEKKEKIRILQKVRTSRRHTTRQATSAFAMSTAGTAFGSSASSNLSPRGKKDL